MIWFIAKDIATALGYAEATISNAINTLFQSVPSFWADKKRILVRSDNGVVQERDMLCLTEQGVYFFLGRSDKPKALPYQIWIANDVVPSIRKTGGYVTPKTQEELITNPDFIIKLAQALKEERQKVNALEQKVENDKPKVTFAEAVDTSKESILIGNLAKLLRQNGINIGQNRLFSWLRDNGYLISCKGERWNMPTQESIDKGLCDVKERVINNADGSTRITYTTKVTGHGQIFFINYFLQEKENLITNCMKGGV